MVFVLFCFYAFLAGCNSPAFFVPLGMAMTIQQYINKLKKNAEDLQNGRAFVSQVSQTITEQADRIFTDGLDDRGRPIGNYSTRPTYINTMEASPKKLPAIGKTGQKKFKNGKPHKSTYFAGGYRQFKQRAGRGGKFNLFLFGNFNRAFLAGAARPTLLTEPTRLVALFAIKAGVDNPAEKLQGLLERYPNAFKLSINEKVNHRARISALWNNAFK
jgi:hypothetical protein